MRFPNEPKRIRYTSKDKFRSGDIEYISLDDEIPKNAELAYAVTYHSLQGLTVEDPRKVWMVAPKLEGSAFYQAAYTASTRVQYRRQLGIIMTIPDGNYSRRTE